MPNNESFESALIHQQLQSSGVAQVIVVMKSQPVASGDLVAKVAAVTRGPGVAGMTAAARADATMALSSVASHFRNSEFSQSSALASAGLALSGAGAASARRQPAARRLPVHVYPNLGIMLGTVDRDGLAGLRADARVASVSGSPQLSLIRPVSLGPAKLTQQVTWGIESLGVEKLWNQGLTGQGVRVAHLDTGADGKHPALKKAISVFAEFDNLGQIVKPTPAPHDTDEHGTHTAATIAGRPVNGKSVGVAFEAELASAIVIEGGEVVARVLAGLDWALDQGVKVLSMSLGLRGWFEDFLPIVQILRSRGVLPVIASGNEGPGTSRSPGNYPESLSVGAADEQHRVADFSSSQKFQRAQDPIVPDLVGPGVGVLSAKPGGEYQSMSGTSMATPHLAGLAALLLHAKPTATINEVELAIFQSCKLLGTMSQDRAGRGFPDAVVALEKLTGMTFSSAKKKPAMKAKPKKKSATQEMPKKKPAKRKPATKK